MRSVYRRSDCLPVFIDLYCSQLTGTLDYRKTPILIAADSRLWSWPSGLAVFRLHLEVKRMWYGVILF